MQKIWQRYFLKELFKVFALFVASFYFLYVLIDYSAHTKVFQNVQISFFDIFLYYAFQFTKRAEILVPVALMIATIKVLTSANIRNEIVALATGGISLKKITHPFIAAALFCALLLYLNFQLLQPFAMVRLQTFEERYFRERQEDQNKQVNAFTLQDNTLLIYQLFHQEKKAFFDVFWLKDFDHIYRIQTLYPFQTVPFGNYVDELARNSNGEMVKISSAETASFPDMRFDAKALFNAVHPPRMQSLKQLVHTLGWKKTHFGLGKMNDREAEAAAVFYFRLTIPLFCLLAVLGPAPYCLRFSRNLPIFFIYAISLFGMVTFFTLVNSSVILGESQTIAPILAILLPQMVFFSVLGWKYAKL